MGEKYKLVYFNGRGLGEFARVLFKYANVEFEDVRHEKEQWPELKAKQPFGKLPVLQVGNTVISESGAIYRFLAKKFGLNGKNDLEAAQADMVLEALRDLFSNRIKYVLETDETKKEEMRKKFFAEMLPPFLDNLEKILKANGGAHFAGKELTYADIGMSLALSELISHCANALDKYPLLKGLKDKTLAIPAIKKWLEVRPKTAF